MAIIRGDLNGVVTNDRLDGTGGNDILIGGLGTDTYVVDSPNDRIVETSGTGIETVEAWVSWNLSVTYDPTDPTFNRLNAPDRGGLDHLTLLGTANLNGTGNDVTNTITGNSGHNRLDGGKNRAGVAADTLIGGYGNDTYVVNNIGDQIQDVSGWDQVESAMSWSLGAGLEDLTLTGESAINGTGNELRNVIRGNNARNILDGQAGDDTLQAGGGNDELRGGAGNDYLDGGTGADLMIGGAGGTIYVVDDLGDQINDGGDDPGVASEDLVLSSISFTLSADLNHLTFRGTDNLTGTGNALGNKITGNSGANILSGLDGADGIRGGAGDDQIIGGSGDDDLTGGTGRDRFVMNSRFEGKDTIRDFSVAEDSLVVSKAGFPVARPRFLIGSPDGFVLTPGSSIQASQFRVGSQAQDSNDFFIYNRTTGVLSFDGDGSRSFLSPIQIAQFSNLPDLTASHIVVSA